ncbi:expressed unknown protein [Seminavis robusta]|uniref:Uncharacterized protein n=1 Tax=Seminavis robusta TaxID=568900 RepID=A0A9N8HSI8_9STRA|nr:expressed unknown protein [Seminavis robusta]|eukprot:Sro1171_g248921.1  (115) ;mRNA; r:33129-33473
MPDFCFSASLAPPETKDCELCQAAMTMFSAENAMKGVLPIETKASCPCVNSVNDAKTNQRFWTGTGQIIAFRAASFSFFQSSLGRPAKATSTCIAPKARIFSWEIGASNPLVRR